MPQFKNIKIGHFQINVKPKRSLQRIWPYFVGNRVEFELQIIDTELKMDSSSLHIFEIFENSEKILDTVGRQRITGNWQEIIGFPIDREGNIIYKIGLDTKETYAEPIILGYVINKDRWLLGLLGFILGIIGTLGTQILLRLIYQ